MKGKFLIATGMCHDSRVILRTNSINKKYRDPAGCALTVKLAYINFCSAAIDILCKQII